jgi:hypothetical protein
MFEAKMEIPARRRSSKMRKAIAPVLLTVCTILMGSVPVFGDVLFTDSTFSPANYSQTASFLNSTALSIAGSQCAACGDPAKALQIAIMYGDTSSTEGMADLGFVNNTFSYDPLTQGAISSISASVDKDIDINLGPGPSFTFGNTFRPMIEQDGNFYLAAIPGPTFDGGDTGFLSLSSSGLVASDFLEFNFSTDSFSSGTPNFAGDPMLLGIGQIASLGVSGVSSSQETITYDNLSFDLQTVPEPSSWGLLTGLLVAFGLALRRRQLSRIQ